MATPETTMTLGDFHACKVSEAAREREAFKYDAFERAGAAVDNDDDDCPPRDRQLPSMELTASPDPGLAAFAQLGLYRLGAEHARISLFDRSHQYIISEAQQPSSLCSRRMEGRRKPRSTRIPRDQTICEHVLTGLAGQLPTGTTYEAVRASIPVLVVPDLRLDERFRHLAEKDWRFYAGVPIRSPAGINIGVYCVFDTKPRPAGLADVERRFIRDISLTAMEHLQFRRSNRWCRLEDRMVGGLGSFVEGKSSLSPVVEQPSSEQPGSAARGRFSGGQEGVIVGPQHPGGAPDDVPSIPVETPITHARPQPREPQADGGAARPTKADLLQGEVEAVFSSAANIIRQCLQAEGVMFLDASIHSYGGVVGKVADLAESKDPSPDAGGLLHQDDSTCNVLGFSTLQGSSLRGDNPAASHAAITERDLQKLLDQYPGGHIINFELDESRPDPPVSAPDVIRASTRSRESNIAMVDGPEAASTAEEGPTCLSRIFPGARSVAIVPLWEPQRSRWFASGFVWSKTPSKFFTENELNYLKVFGLATMAQVARLNTNAAIKTKADILGSISHELRSPLHGVVGAVELLRDTPLDGFQESILSTIEKSGRTLLDTIDHLLDYSQTKKLIRDPHTESKSSTASFRKRSSSSSISSSGTTLDVPVQLDLLVEDVVESVMAGHSFRFVADPSSMPRCRRGSRPKPTRQRSTEYLPGDLWCTNSGAVQIYLDIDPSSNWSFHTHPGAFRRIIMNLFANSLKFTASGSITVSLRQEPAGPGQSGDSSARVVLAVADSGRGMSKAYLRNHLFTPFSQEDHFAPGTGLGLSLVRQMTSTLGGRIDVGSSVGKGTTVTVSLPLSRCHADSDDGCDFRDAVRQLAGRRVRLRGFGEEGAVPGSETPGEECGSPTTQRRLVEGVCRKWLRMEVVDDRHEGDGELPPDFVICGEEGSSQRSVITDLAVVTCPHIFICRNSAVARELCKPFNGQAQRCFEFLSKPIGPRKLAHALIDGQLRWDSSRSSSTDLSAGSDGRSLMDVSASPYFAGADDGLSPPPPIINPLGELKLGEAGDRVAPSVVMADTSLPPSQAELAVSDSTPQAQGPKQQPAEPARSPAVKAVTAPGEERAPILIVDDNSVNLKLLSAYMKKLNHPHTSAVNGLEALEKYTQAPDKYSCVLTDISMPVMDGLESTRRIRAFERERGLQPAVVIALTGLGGADVRRDACASGVDLMLTRPIVLKGLMEALEATGLR